ncbi:MAG TPA: hypothetical protein VFQ61_36460 [Polyangiaceae bacterium]|nr:hypothetical protein [Polyangiaceae bacterium]
MTVHTEREPTEDEWARYMGGADAHKPLEEQRILVLSEGGSPNGTQRKQLIELLADAKVPTAILTNNWLMRAAGAAVSWFNPSLKVFGPLALEAAMNYLQLTPWERSESVRLIREFQRELGLPVLGRVSLAGLELHDGPISGARLPPEERAP